jgi:hypothetical protein
MWQQQEHPDHCGSNVNHIEFGIDGDSNNGARVGLWYPGLGCITGGNECIDCDQCIHRCGGG